MAAFTSAASGNWNASATWGKAGDPPVKGTDFPGTAGDTFTVDAGHTVTYNVSESNALGDSTIAATGVLTFLHTMSTKLIFGHNDLTDNGTLNMGTSANPIGAAYTCEVYHTTTSDGAKGLKGTGTVNMYGSAVYGTEYKSYLTAAWSAGQTFTVNGSAAQSWVAGQEIILPRTATVTNRYTIASVAANGANTDVTIAEAAPGITFVQYAPVYVITRNVIWGKISWTKDNFNSNRPFITATTLTMNIDKTSWAGFSYVKDWANGSLTDSVFRDSGNSFFTCYGLTVSDSIFYYLNRLVGNNCWNINISNSFFSAIGLLTQTGQFFSDTVFQDCVYHGTITSLANCKLVECFQIGGTYGFGLGNALIMIGGGIGISKEGAVIDPTTTFDFYSNGSAMARVTIKNTILPSGGITHRRNVISSHYTGKINFCNYNNVDGAMLSAQKMGDAIKNTVTVRVGGSTSSIELVPQSNITIASGISSLAWHEHSVPASAQTRKIYVIGEGWTSYPTAAQLFLRATYLDAASGSTVSTIESTEVIDENTNWHELTVTFTPGQEGTVIYEAYLGVYEAACKAYIDNALYNGTNKAEASWLDGESSLNMDYADWTPAASGGGGMRIINGGPINV